MKDSTSPLSKSVPVKAIELVNAQVKKVQLNKTSTHDCKGDSLGKNNRGRMLTPAQKYEIGKGAAITLTIVTLVVV